MTFWCQYEFCELDTRISISGYLKIDLAFSLQCHVKCGVSSVFFFFFFPCKKFCFGIWIVRNLLVFIPLLPQLPCFEVASNSLLF